MVVYFYSFIIYYKAVVLIYIQDRTAGGAKGNHS